jgi:hypothetical protein
MDYTITRVIVDNFVETTQQAHHGYRYPAGYLQSLVVDLLGEVPADTCKQYLRILELETKKIKKQMVFSTLKNKTT